MNPRDRLTTAFLLAAGAYLGFYVFGLVMGVFSPGEVLYFTIPAGILVLVLAVLLIRKRRGAPPAEEEAIRDEHRLREKRGF